MESLSLPALIYCLFKLSKLGARTRGTTAETARRWSVLAIAVCLLTTVLRLTLISNQWTSSIQYFAAVMLLTPFVAILGARRPGANAWPWFVVLPLILVLQWPTLSQLTAGTAGSPVAVPTPTVIGFLFVLLMGAGNYFGTLNTTAMFVAALGIVMMLSGVTELIGSAFPWTFPAGCWLLSLSSLLVPRHFFEPHNSGTVSEIHHIELWKDFRDIYGIVWAKRVMDRVNQFSRREDWSVELTMDGFCQRRHDTEQPAAANATTLADAVPYRATEILCWVLRRFVDRNFLRCYMPDSSIPATVAEA